MKVIAILSLLFFAFPVFGELTKEDMRAIIKQEVPPIIKEEIAASEKRTREYIDLKIEGVEKSLSAKIDGVEKSLNARIDGVEKSLNARIDGVEKGLNARIDDIQVLMIALIGLVAAAIAVPQIIIAYRDRGRKETQAQLDQLRERLEAMQQ